MAEHHRWTLTDISPRLIMCPLPKGYRWEVELSPSHDAAFVRLNKKRNVGSLGSSCVLDASALSDDALVHQIIDRSYEVWQKFFRTAFNKNDEWVARAAEVRDQLNRHHVTVKVKVEKVR